MLANARELLAPGGVVLVADEKAGHEFHAPADQLEQLFYGFSVLFCLPTAREERPVGGHRHRDAPAHDGGLRRRRRLRRVEVLPIENDLWRFYLLTP